MTDGVARRTYGLPSRPAPQHDSPAVTPAEELESWLPDEVCAACGSQVAARQLYCSAKCKELDEAKQSVIPAPSSSASQSSTSPTHDDGLAMSPRGTCTRASPSTYKADGSANLRYAYPQASPLLLAQRRARPSAAGFDKALLAHRADIALSRGNGGHQHVDTELRRRSSSAGSSKSTSSNASSSALLTDPSTPSPALGSGKRRSTKGRTDADDVEDDDELNASDFQLPPSITPALTSAIVMNCAEADQHHHHQHQPSTTWERDPRSQHRIPSDPPQRKIPSMSFARRPSSTNLPAPVLYSPALSAKSSRPSPMLRGDKARASETTASKSTVASATSTTTTSINNTRRSFKTHTKIPSLAALESAGRRHSGSGDEITMSSRGQSVDQASLAAKGAPASQPLGRGQPSSPFLAGANFGVGSSLVAPSAPAAVVVMNRSSSDPVPSRSSNVSSPPSQQRGQEDSSSEGTKTLAASRSSQLASLRSPSPSELCGRPGCAGAFSNRSQQDIPAPPATGSTARRPSLSSSASINRTPSASESTSRRDARRHRHTHSAQAGLSIHAHFNMRPQLLMTPARATKALPSPSASPSGMVSPAAPAAVTGHAGGRGRSKMRDSRSVSRRSRSPPRAAARGRSQALASEERARKQPHPDSPPIEAVKPRSQPIAITRRPSGQAAAASSVSSSAAASSVASASLAADEPDVSSQGGRGRGRRGRSPTQERQRRISSVAIKAAPLPLVDMSHRQDVQRKDTSDESFDSYDVGGGSKADPGFDDVEGLELEA